MIKNHGRRLEAQSAADVVYARLKEEIVAGRRAGGAALRQDEIASENGMSKIPVREALRRLEIEGLVEFRPRRGAIVRQLSDSDILELLDIRIALECRALELAVHNMVESDHSLAREILEEYSTSTSPERWSELNLRFHHCIYEPCGNRHLLLMIRELEQRMGPFTRLRVTQASGLERPHSEHVRILEACVAGDAHSAVAELRGHIQTTQKEVAAFFRRMSLRLIKDQW
ncbi:MAG: GntR family transcriptional regulator [Paracoccaceae bacterium]|nr:GntR family transcriptional regulator [Paracoccaceae bacterium]MDE2913847.1 GntR family transcriptional regulator [Paracoccaceae bacterium]